MTKNTYAYLVAFAAALGGSLFGYEIAVITQTITMDSFGLFLGIIIDQRDDSGAYIQPGDSRSLTASVAFLFLLGCVIGAIIVSWLSDAWGRRKSILMAGLIFVAAGLLQSFASTRAIFFSGRLLGGLSIGILSMCSPLYISEISPAAERGRMVAILQLMVTIGTFIASCINSIIIKTLQTDAHNDLEWRLVFGLQALPALLLVSIIFFMPESPRWLAGQDKDAECLSVLSTLRALPKSDTIIQQEYKEILDGVEHERSVGGGSWSEVFSPSIIGRTMRACVLQMFQQWTGINVILYYQGILLTGMGLDRESANIQFTIANNLINVIASLPGMYYIERVGRRKLLFYGGIGMGISHLLVCLFIKLGDTGRKPFYYLAILSLYLFFFNFASTWGPIAWVYQSEIFPLRVRSKATGLATINNWLNNALISYITPIYFQPLGGYMYLIFAFTAFTMATFVHFFIPETMGKSLEEMNEVFGCTDDECHDDREELGGKLGYLEKKV